MMCLAGFGWAFCDSACDPLASPAPANRGSGLKRAPGGKAQCATEELTTIEATRLGAGTWSPGGGSG